MKKDDRARLISQYIAKPLPTGYCLSFYYHMYGPDIGSLMVYAVDDEVNRKEFAVFSKNGTQADKWRQAFVKLEANDLKNDFKLAFDGIAGNDIYKGK
jgi:hypothetical protein